MNLWFVNYTDMFLLVRKKLKRFKQKNYKKRNWLLLKELSLNERMTS